METLWLKQRRQRYPHLPKRYYETRAMVCVIEGPTVGLADLGILYRTGNRDEAMRVHDDICDLLEKDKVEEAIGKYPGWSLLLEGFNIVITVPVGEEKGGGAVVWRWRTPPVV